MLRPTTARLAVLALAVIAASPTLADAATPTTTVPAAPATTVPVAPATAAAPTTTAPAASSGPQEFALDDPAFFTAPAPIPAGNHGDLVRFQPVDTSFVETYRIMYLTESVSGAPTVATAILAVDEERAPFGGYPVLLYGHGSIGMADSCAPSAAIGTLDDDRAQEFDSVSSATSHGYAVVGPDYEGLGGPGRHPYLVGISEGRSMLDAGLAARHVPGVYLSPETSVLGFSQGGHAALWATQLAPQWTPTQPITGTILAAPASEVIEYVQSGVADPANAAAPVSVIAGLAAAYPDAQAAIGTVLTAAGQELVTAMDEHCFDESIQMPAGPLLAADPLAVEPFASLIAAQTAGTVASPTPMLILHGDADMNVPLALSDQLLGRLCAAGQTVERRVLAGQNHFIALDDRLPRRHPVARRAPRRHAAGHDLHRLNRAAARSGRRDSRVRGCRHPDRRLAGIPPRSGRARPQPVVVGVGGWQSSQWTSGTSTPSTRSVTQSTSAVPFTSIA